METLLNWDWNHWTMDKKTNQEKKVLPGQNLFFVCFYMIICYKSHNFETIISNRSFCWSFQRLKKKLYWKLHVKQWATKLERWQGESPNFKKSIRIWCEIVKRTQTRKNGKSHTHCESRLQVKLWLMTCNVTQWKIQ